MKWALGIVAALIVTAAASIWWIRAQNPRPPSDPLDITLTWTTSDIAPEFPEWTWALRCAPDGTFAYRWRPAADDTDGAWRERRGTWKREPEARALWTLTPDEEPKRYTDRRTRLLVLPTLRWDTSLIPSQRSARTGGIDPAYSISTIDPASGNFDGGFRHLTDPRYRDWAGGAD